EPRPGVVGDAFGRRSLEANEIFGIGAHRLQWRPLRVRRIDEVQAVSRQDEQLRRARRERNAGLLAGERAVSRLERDAIWTFPAAGLEPRDRHDLLSARDPCQELARRELRAEHAAHEMRAR